MARAIDLSARGRKRRELQADIDAAAARLRQRADRLDARALRARVGSNDRRTSLSIARHLRACAAMIDHQDGFGEKLDRELLRTGGWRRLADACVMLARKTKIQSILEKQAADLEEIMRAQAVTGGERA